MTDSEDDVPNGGDDGTADDDAAFGAELVAARELLEADGISAFHVAVVRDGREVDTTFAQQADDPREEGLQALSLLAAHLRLVAGEAGVDLETVAGDAVSLARDVEPGPDESGGFGDEATDGEG